MEFLFLEHISQKEPEIIAGINLNDIVTEKEGNDDGDRHAQVPAAVSPTKSASSVKSSITPLK